MNLTFFNFSVGIVLIAMSTDQLCKRIAAEMDFYSLSGSKTVIDIVNKDSPLYEPGDFLPFLRSGKFATLSANDLTLVLDRYLLTKVGAFPDCFERLAENYFSKDDVVSALVTCERSISVFYGWGHPVKFYANMLNRIPGREKEAADAARNALGMPAWTIGNKMEELEALAKLAGFSGLQIDYFLK